MSGISYGYQGMQFKRAQLGNACKWQAIKILSLMNKKEIAKQYTRQILGQENSSQPVPDTQQPAVEQDLLLIQSLIPEIERLYSKRRKSTGSDRNSNRDNSKRSGQ